MRTSELQVAARQHFRVTYNELQTLLWSHHYTNWGSKSTPVLVLVPVVISNSIRVAAGGDNLGMFTSHWPLQGLVKYSTKWP